MTIPFCIRHCLIVVLLAANSAHAEAITAASASLSLQRWLIENVDNHPSVQAAASAADASSFQLIAADKALYNPELEIDTESIGNRDTRTIGISQSIDWGDTRGARTAVASSEKAAADFGLEVKRRDIAIELLTALSAYHTTSALKDLAEQGNALMLRSAELAAQRYAAGDLGKVEVDLANLSYAQARFKRAEAVANQVRAVQNLIALTGSIDRSWPAFNADLPDPKSDIQDVDKLIKQLPEMRQILSRVAASQARVKVQTAQGAASPTFSIRTGKEEQESLLGMTLSVPLQIRNNFKAEIDVANAEMIQAERASIAAYRNLKSRLEIATVSYELSRDAWLAWQASGANTLVEQVKLLERLWKAGELSTTDYLVQLTQILDTKASAIEQRGRMWSDWSEWLVASGKIDRWLNTGESK